MGVGGQEVTRIQRQDSSVRAKKGDLARDARAGQRPTQSISIEPQSAVQVAYAQGNQRDARFHVPDPKRSRSAARLFRATSDTARRLPRSIRRTTAESVSIAPRRPASRPAHRFRTGAATMVSGPASAAMRDLWPPSVSQERSPPVEDRQTRMFRCRSVRLLLPRSGPTAALRDRVHRWSTLYGRWPDRLGSKAGYP